MTKTLELDQIIEIISKYLKSDSAKQKLNTQEPSTNMSEIEHMLLEVNDMLELIAKFGRVPFFR